MDNRNLVHMDRFKRKNNEIDKKSVIAGQMLRYKTYKTQGTCCYWKMIRSGMAAVTASSHHPLIDYFPIIAHLKAFSSFGAWLFFFPYSAVL